ncbi:2-C-methyl-D-erythritol 4-phosphate cytidylyltransferase [Caldicellulosiruptor saccharolyticus DSM 8903]|uniref:2-C-methyl-D-erythritol 4-phosphate cytidylyltransferase n=1 Tax=Caldicellulosiruptor saccharolyticus (strain ATCC 43494 / DSM 8903 / Tp8T 6331) TaxID=351627 RepID=ISPD_CALS8|nr:2-C-methyl-D-erythritol 4-phosphate cytidylyltransferase [Caldicellulosiruptor saccharolyticus]A4XLJ3.1 RecName: Full=2-C-methyl-D-erythritol 4-phosphate cytidylyltransferase; AltName: Full=4-diphosphocytidyl-2C-methyl-D-erythritol synthase; AltName: Full=MEP cytidylyltransferase; Short=MCT [Caldicellulosiruptor saccharolyticus DSM 8903]ABP67778.1 2-C-methyl-D-erythritol 4-phosphate cytidylyltransferase [Caldicellulosiruptor saccharolyticus DSM 8903]
MRTFALVCAAGSGKRFGGSTPKQFLFLEDKMVIEYSLCVFENSPFIDGVVILIPNGYKNIGDVLKEKYKKVLFWDYGEDERAKTVKKGLELIKGMCDFVAIHDAVRPFIDLELIEKLILEVKSSFAVAPAVSAKDTVKYVVDGYVQNTIPRENVYLVQTPQVFKFDLIYGAYEKFEDTCFTDDLQYVEALGVKPKIVENSSLNFKITTKEDMIFAKAIVEQFLK